MRARWFSQQGRERACNSDAAALGQQGQHLLAMLVDGAEKGPRGAELARHWADVVLQALAEASTRSPAAVHARLKQEQAKLRHGFLRDIASYCMVSLDLETLATQVWHCGDCRVGLRQQAETRWLTTPHILAQQPGLLSPCSPEEQDRQEQQLTRCLNARRFRAPEHHVFSLQQGQTLLLSTDGYWQEHLEAGTPRHSLRDDASLLTLPVGSAPLDHIDQASDTDNLRHFSLA
ncbi:protein phosphatase 2C domain-containing protein [Halomonas alimentaria]|uniref:SpoIIE family protein phosphatase n=1 Tax=Halomonas alimentaria TaxID=147248 RepID=A0A7X4W3V3_9GAMM|nr:protein phosphatase 2C domain-containing protein [Halomonas alimentaria]NAW33735.1 SpoIIE family protein phosphatase [Halomonas alimentaria]